MLSFMMKSHRRPHERNQGQSLKTCLFKAQVFSAFPSLCRSTTVPEAEKKDQLLQTFFSYNFARCFVWM